MKIGIYSIPDVDPQKAVDFAKTIYDFPNHKITKDGFSSKTGISMTGGWFGMIILGMRTYGLVEENDDVLTTTDLMPKLLYPKPGTTELQDARNKVFNSVPLWKKLFSDQLKKTDIAKDDFWVYLSELDGIKGLDREKVKKKAPLVQKGYMQALSYLAGVTEPISPTTPKPEKTKFEKTKPESRAIGNGRSERHTPTETEGKELIKLQKGGLYIEILQDEKALENIEYAKDLLEFMGNKIRKSKQSNN
jgi:hypothetical protein